MAFTSSTSSAFGFNIQYESEGFPGVRGISRIGQLLVTWDDILWAAVTIGRPNLHYVFRHGEASFYEAMFRWSLVRMALYQTGSWSPELSRTDAFNELDPTEKGAINYFLGMVICKLFADRLLGTPWMLHLDVFKDHLAPSLLSGRSRPDLVGQENGTGKWHAFECKGRASVPGSDEKRKAKAQAQRLVSLGQQNCDLHIGAITFFKNDVLRFYWRDPEPDDAEPIELPEAGISWRAYYEPISELIRAGYAEFGSESDASVDLQLVRVESADVSVGAHPKILPLLMDREWNEARLLSENLQEEFAKMGCRRDGLIVTSGESWRKLHQTSPES